MKNISEKAKKMSASMTLELTAKAAKMKSKGIDVISFGVGEPDFNTPKNIREAAILAMNSGKTKYTPASGLLKLKAAIRDKFLTDNNLEYTEKNIVVSTGAKQNLANAFLAILNPGDEVIIATPYWVSYPELIRLADGISIEVDTGFENSFKLTPDVIKSSCTLKTKAIVINSPNNPTGAIYTEAELSAIANICKELDLYIISDEIYEKLNYEDDHKHVSIASLSEDAKERTIVINGFSKAYAMTGWRLGYSASNIELAKIMGTIQSHTTSNPNTIAQYAGIEALVGAQKEVDEMVNVFKARRNRMINHLDEIKNISYIEPKGAFYCFINIEKLLTEKMNTSLEFSKSLLSEENVMVIPGIAFGNDKYIRLSYATSEKNIDKGMDRIKKFVNNISHI